MKPTEERQHELNIPTPTPSDAGIETVQMTTEQVLAAVREEADALKEQGGAFASLKRIITRRITGLFSRTATPSPEPARAPAAQAITVASPPPTVKLNKGTAKWAVDALALVDTSSQRMRIVVATDDDIAPHDALSLCEKLVGDPTQGALTSVILKKNFSIPLSLCRKFFNIQGLSPKTKHLVLQKIDPGAITDRGPMCFLLASLRDEALIAPALQRFSFEIRNGVVRVDIAKLRTRLEQQENAAELLAQLERVETLDLGEEITWETLRAQIAIITDPNIIAALFSKLGLDLVQNTPKQ